LILAATETVAAKIRRNRVTGSFLTMGQLDPRYGSYMTENWVPGLLMLRP
jgi:hypothetical protein